MNDRLPHHVMFDIDGTLINSTGFDTECFTHAVYEELGHEVDSNWESYKHVSDSGILIEHLQRHGITGDTQHILGNVKRRFVALVQQHLSQHPAQEIAGASQLINHLMALPQVQLSIATGGWRDSAMLKLKSAGIDAGDIPLASSDQHPARIDIMKQAQQMTGVSTPHQTTYFGDGEWDRQACSDIGFDFVLVGNAFTHDPSVADLTDIQHILSVIGLA